MKTKRKHDRRAGKWGQILLLMGVVAVLWVPQALAEADRCVACHAKADFMVTNKKLYNYHLAWKSSIHGQEGVGCAECHGGNSKANDKKTAHGKNLMGAKSAKSPVNYRNIPKTCAQCHEAYFDSFSKSKHFRKLKKKKATKKGPNCVTCHGSVNTQVLNVVTVKKACAQCHNKKTKLKPDMPQRAETVLNEFLSIHRYYRFLTVRGNPRENQETFRHLNALIEDLGVLWHSFQIGKIEKSTRQVLNLVKEKRNEIKKRK